MLLRFWMPRRALTLRMRNCSAARHAFARCWHARRCSPQQLPPRARRRRVVPRRLQTRSLQKRRRNVLHARRRNQLLCASGTRRSAAAAAPRSRTTRQACRSRRAFLLEQRQRCLRWRWMTRRRLLQPCAAAGAQPPRLPAGWRSMPAQRAAASPLPLATLSRRTRRTMLVTQLPRQSSPQLRRSRCRRLCPPLLPRRRRRRRRRR